MLGLRPKVLSETDEQRFWSKVALPNEQGCMEWMAVCNPGGYGQFWIQDTMRSAHILSYRHLVGDYDSSMELDHLCRNRKCVRPDHLEPVTKQENIRRGQVGLKSGALQRAKTHCVRGHEYDEVNTLIRKNGSRQCRTCNRERVRAARARKEK